MSKKKMTIYGGIVAAIVAMAFAAPALAETPEQLRQRADRMELAEARAEATKALVREVLADAESRTMLQGNGSPVTVNVHGFAQTRYSYSGGGGLEANHGFNVPRARLILSGDIYDWEYKVSGQWSDSTNTFDLKDAYAQGGLFGGTFRVGQFKSPFMREVLVAQQDTLMTDRSIIANTFGQGRSQGIQWSKDMGKLDRFCRCIH